MELIRTGSPLNSVPLRTRYRHIISRRHREGAPAGLFSGGGVRTRPFSASAVGPRPSPTRPRLVQSWSPMTRARHVTLQARLQLHSPSPSLSLCSLALLAACLAEHQLPLPYAVELSKELNVYGFRSTAATPMARAGQPPVGIDRRPARSSPCPCRSTRMRRRPSALLFACHFVLPHA